MKTLNEIAIKAKALGKKTRIAVAVAEDSNTLGALARAAQEGFIYPILIGSQERILALPEAALLPKAGYQIIDLPDSEKATKTAVRMVKSGEADVLMKGLVGTDKFLKEVLNKTTGLLPPKAVMSYTCALELPKYHKLLLISDTAVLPNPDLTQKIAMLNYSVKMANALDIVMPKVALISATEKVSEAMPNTIDYALISKMAQRAQIKGCVVDGPLDIFLACDPSSLAIKGVESPIAGAADILIFPNLETANAFYKGLMLFAQGELAGLIQGTTKPVIVMSRSESENSKYYCIALSCLMTEER
ncbi:MAG: phosphate acetyltransferase [Candidatus Cloacimonetes bacterium]|jgi:phosphate butyryltransferase|nr:phosphate acetyltransferase [Candidatus Cloacimonadota bacterium]MCB5287161.1 phosphate acetyltransferase [Candidatus Cloacimonadota bacterium]MCK9184877.1 phosphate acyltransferase [Candidatus Cloacimonadota bacterium]MCK9583678.1 phosphate acyltransferase [Candidatus Cloacimonadota bacterium]MDY0229482.1 phosphate acyltransferase [Candidatus Cloacimonadaceae bacterium]